MNVSSQSVELPDSHCRLSNLHAASRSYFYLKYKTR